jgi:bacterioferritin
MPDKKKHTFGIAAIRAAAKDFEDGAVTIDYQNDRKNVRAMLNEALATELARWHYGDGRRICERHA